MTAQEAKTLPEGFRAYRTPTTAEHYAIDPTQPLPQAVVDDMTQRLDNGLGNPFPIMAQLEEVTGRRIIKVWYTYGSWDPTVAEAHDMWMAAMTPEDLIVKETATRDEALAAAQAYVAAQPNPAEWVIVTTD